MKENIPGGSRYRTLNWPPSTYRATRSTATGTTRSLQVEKFALAEGLIDRVIYGRAPSQEHLHFCGRERRPSGERIAADKSETEGTQQGPVLHRHHPHVFCSPRFCARSGQTA